MEAKDIAKKEIIRQAEFGYEPSYEDMVIAGQTARRKEVVDWVQSQWPHLFHTPYISEEVWQAKLKEWGIDNAL